MFLALLGPSKQAYASLPNKSPLAPAFVPMTFRMDGLHADNVHHTVRGEGHVLLRRDALVLCCDTMTAQADLTWAWTQITCTGRVRASRPGERAWADKATYDPNAQTLTLSGSPRIRREGNVMHGKTIIMHIQDQRIEVLRPRGVLMSNGPSDLNWGADLPLDAPLPDRCLVPWLE
jgi:lipopolysaccharide transport protein LptA